jgi:hypothetical protein
MPAVNLPVLKDAIEFLGLALATHHHVWTDEQRLSWERAWAEIRRHQSTVVDPLAEAKALQRRYRKVYATLSPEERAQLAPPVKTPGLQFVARP